MTVVVAFRRPWRCLRRAGVLAAGVYLAVLVVLLCLEDRLLYRPAPVSRVWRCGNRGNVASVLIEKPPRGDFLPLVRTAKKLGFRDIVVVTNGRMFSYPEFATATVEGWGGRLVKVVGDGALFLAPDASTAAAVAFALIAACAGRPELPALRGGLAGGEVVLDGDDCFGLAVNLAAKSAALARPGSVVATRAVVDELGDAGTCAPGAALPGVLLGHLPAFVELFELDRSEFASRTSA